VTGGAVLPQTNPRGRFQFFARVPVTSRRGLEPNPGAVVSWRLLAANQRTLGYAVDGHPSLADAIDQARSVAASVAFLRARVALGADNRWRWELLHGRVVVAQSVRGYQRRIECDLAVRQFVTLAVDANFCARLEHFPARGR
jgi:hypothetical protein